MSVQDQLEALRRELAELRGRVDVIEQAAGVEQEPLGYAAVEIGQGSVAFRSVTKPFRYLCANCHAQGKHSVLYPMADTMLNRRAYGGPAVQCPTCNTVIPGSLHA